MLSMKIGLSQPFPITRSIPRNIFNMICYFLTNRFCGLFYFAGYEDITESPVMQPTKPVRTDSTLKHKKKPPSPVNSIFRSTGTNSKIYHEKEAFYFIERLDLLFNE